MKARPFPPEVAETSKCSLTRARPAAAVLTLLLLTVMAVPADGADRKGDAGSFGAAGVFPEERRGAAATSLADDGVLFVGGGVGDGAGAALAYRWDSVEQSFAPAGSLAQPRLAPTATRLRDGRVLVVGGFGGSTAELRSLDSAEIWDPATASFAPTGSPRKARAGHTATLLTDGRVLVVGGARLRDGAPRTSRSAEVWDPVSGMFSPAGPLAEARYGHSATNLLDGRVLVVGGVVVDDSGVEIRASTEAWDPTTGAFSLAGALPEGRVSHSATLLPDGRVLIVGGIRSGGASRLASALLWDPTTEAFSPAGALESGRAEHTATSSPDGSVLIVGGGGDDGALRVAELWDPTTASFGPAGSLAMGRDGHTATRLADGRVLIAGGTDDNGMFMATAELYDPSAGRTTDGVESFTEPLPEPTSAPIVGPVYARGTVGLSLDGVDAAQEAWAMCQLVDSGRTVRNVMADRRIRLGGIWVTLELRLREDGPRLRLLTSPDVEPQTVYRSDEGTRMQTTLGLDGSTSIRFEGLPLRKGQALDLPGDARSLGGSLTWSCLSPPELGGPEPEGDPDPDDRGGLSGRVTMSSVATGSAIADLDLDGACDSPDYGFSFWSKAVAWPDGRTILVQLQNMDGEMYVSLAPSGSKLDVIAVGAVSEAIAADWPDFAVEGRLDTVDGEVLVTGEWRCR